MIALKEHSGPARSFERLPASEQPPTRTEHPLNSEVGQPPGRDTQPDRKIKNILVPTNFSANSAEAADRAAELARHHGATLTVLHVLDINSPAAWMHSGTAEGLMNGLWTEGISKLQCLVESLAGKLPSVRSCLAEGLPAEEIIHHSQNFDLVVLGEDRPKGVWSLFSRNIAHRVVEGVECPVMVVHRGEQTVMFIAPEGSTTRGSRLGFAPRQS